MIYLTNFESSLVQLMLGIGLVLMLPAVLDKESRLHRTLLFGLVGVLAIRYVWWRATQTLAPFGLTWDCLASWSFFAIEAASIVSSLSAFTILTRTKNRTAEADRLEGWWKPARAPKAVVLIATYNEERDVLERTLNGASGLDYDNFEVLVLDDGRRPWLAELSAEKGARYLTRPDNFHAKAGNINHALRLLAEEDEPPEFVAVLDADFVPHANFLSRTIALFAEPDVGLVQTPQHFFNADPIQHNFGLSSSYPDEQRFFFDHLQPARDGWGIAFCCGTSSVTRFGALKAIGFLPTGSVTEDFLLTIALQNAGWRTVYLNEAVTEGLAPEGLKEYVTQRARWCLGLMQIVRGPLGPLGRNELRWQDRWSLLDSTLYWTSTFAFRLAALVYPLFYWYFGVTVVDASVPDVISFFGVYFVFVLAALNAISGGLVVPLINDVSQMLGAIPITRAAWTGLLKPHGHPFKVTAKGGDRSRIVVQWTLMRPFLILFVLTFIGLILQFFSYRLAYTDAGDGKVVILFWSFYNLVVLGLTIFVCIELPRVERHVADVPERATVAIEGATQRVWMSDLTLDSVWLRGASGRVGAPLSVAIEGIGDIAGTVGRATPGGVLATFAATPEQKTALQRRLYAKGDAPGVTRTRYGALVSGFLKRVTSGTS